MTIQKELQKAMHLVAASTKVRGQKRNDLLAEATKVIDALREPSTKHATFGRLMFQRSKKLLELAISKLGGHKGQKASTR